MIPKKVTIKVYQNILINELFDEYAKDWRLHQKAFA